MRPTVAKVMTNAALFEHMLISASRATIFLTRDTRLVSIKRDFEGGEAYREVEQCPLAPSEEE